LKVSLTATLILLLSCGLIACGGGKTVTPPAAPATTDVVVTEDNPLEVDVTAPEATADPDDVAEVVTDPIAVPEDVAAPLDIAAPVAVDIPVAVEAPIIAPTDFVAPVLVPAKVAAPIKLKPYTAIYSSSFNGMDAEMERSLKQTADNLWQLRNSASILFFDLEEKAQFSTAEGALTPLSYDYRNNMSSKRNSKLRFDTSQHSAFDSLHSKQPLPLPPNSFDKLSYQTQLRLELLQNQGKLLSETFHLVDRHKLKSYQFSQLGDEQIDTPAGRFNSIKLSQSRTGKDEHTLIWLAADWDYFVLRIQRVEDGKVEFQVDLNAAKIDGKAIQGL
jgi:hypothetical protein